MGIGRVSAGCRQGVGFWLHGARITDLGPNVLSLPQKADTLRYPCDPMPTGGVSQLFVNDTNGYRSFLEKPIPFYFFFKKAQ